MASFNSLNKTILYTKVRSRNDAIKLREEAIEISGQGKSVVIFFSKRYHLQLAPGHDPYLVRQEINDWLSKHKHSSPKTESETVQSVTTEDEDKPKNTPERGAGGKFVSKKQDTPNKKSFWDSLR